jgi:hypothetical protein
MLLGQHTAHAVCGGWAERVLDDPADPRAHRWDLTGLAAAWPYQADNVRGQLEGKTPRPDPLPTVVEVTVDDVTLGFG